jgi:hypothetical protein
VKITAHWTHTEEFTREFEVPDGWTIEDEETLLDMIADLDQAQLTEAFDGCTDRSILDVTRRIP